MTHELDLSQELVTPMEQVMLSQQPEQPQQPQHPRHKPLCRYGDSCEKHVSNTCEYRHILCKFDGACRNDWCAFDHAIPKARPDSHRMCKHNLEKDYCGRYQRGECNFVHKDEVKSYLHLQPCRYLKCKRESTDCKFLHASQVQGNAHMQQAPRQQAPRQQAPLQQAPLPPALLPHAQRHQVPQQYTRPYPYPYPCMPHMRYPFMPQPGAQFPPQFFTHAQVHGYQQ